MKILVVNQHAIPGVVEIAVAFSRAGHDTTLFTGYVEHKDQTQVAKIKIQKSIRYRRSSAVTRFASWLVFATHYWFRVMFGSRPDHILVSSNPPLAPLITSWVSKMQKIPFHALILDIYPDALAQAGFISSNNFVYRGWQNANRRMFASAAGIVTLSESMRVALGSYVDPSKVNIISNWTDTTNIRPVPSESNPFVSRYGLNGKLVVMYSGNMGLTHDLESVIEAALRLKDDPRCVFVFVGNGGKKNKLVAIKTQQNLGNVMFLDYQSSEDFPLALAAADVGIVTLGSGAEGISVPSKTYTNMAAGQCLIAICPAKSELARIVDQNNIGYTLEPGQPAKLVAHIQYLIDHPESLTEFRSRSRKASAKFTSDLANEFPKLIFPSGGQSTV